MKLGPSDIILIFNEYLLPMCPILSKSLCFLLKPNNQIVQKAKKNVGNNTNKATVFTCSVDSTAIIVTPDGRHGTVASYYLGNGFPGPSKVVVAKTSDDKTPAKGFSGLVFYYSSPQQEDFIFAPFVSQQSIVFEKTINYMQPIWREITLILSKMERYDNDTKRQYYIHSLCNMAIAIALSYHLINDKGNEAASTVTKVIFELVKWASRTYEGTRIPFGFIISKDDSPGSTEDYTDFLKTKSSALFTDGVFSAIKLNSKGKIISYIPLNSISLPDDKGRLPLCPSRFAGFSQNCTGSDIGIVALSNGDILLFQKNELIFSRRSGRWGAWRNFYFKNAIPDSMIIDPTLLKIVYISLLNASFAHCGACFAIVDNTDKARNLIGDGMLDTKSNNAMIEQKKVLSKN